MVTTPTWSTGNRRHRGRGFTMVELTVVVILVAVLSAMVVPRLAGAAGSVRLKEHAQGLLAAARYAREYAVTHRCDCRLTIDAAGGRYALQRLQTSAEGREEFVPIGLGWGRPVTLGKALRFARVEIDPADGRAEGDWIVFRPSGQAEAATVEITDGQQRYSLVVVPTSGRALLVAGEVEALPNDRVDLDA